MRQPEFVESISPRRLRGVTACLKIAHVLLMPAIACDGDAAGGVQLHLLPSRAMWMIMCFHAVLGDGRGCMSLVSFKIMFLICTRIKCRQAAACSAARGCVGAHLVASGRMPAAAHTHMHTRRHAGDPRAYYMSKNERARARCSFMAVAHVPALVAAAPTASRPAVARSTAASALSHRPLAVAAEPDSPPREAPQLPPLPPLPPLPLSCSALRLPWPLPPTNHL